MTTITREDRIQGVMLGQAAADALGVHYETGIPSKGKAKMLGGGYGFAPGAWSDDTEQAICVLKGRSNPERVARELLDWYKAGPVDVGPTTGRSMAATARALHQGSTEGLAAVMWRASGQAAKGRGEGGWASNGSLMRTSPLPLPLLGTPGKIADSARKVSDLTHADPMAGDATVLWSCAIDRAIKLDGTFDVHSGIYAGIEYLPPERQMTWHSIIHDALNVTSAHMPPRSNLNVVKAFQAALWAIAHHEGYEATIQAAIAIGGDTDTVAAIAGGLAGAMYGASAIPSEWIDVLHGWPGLKAADIATMALDAANGK